MNTKKEKKILVIGGNGFLGNNLLRELLKDNQVVRTSVRNTSNKKPFEGLNCEIVQADLLDKDSLLKAMNGIDIVYNCATVYKIWAKDPQKEIIDVNVQGTKNVLEAAHEAKIKRFIYVGSSMTLARDKTPINELSGWNEDSREHYTISKIRSEKLAWKLAKKYDLDMISILPSGMIGPNSFDHIPPAMEFYYKVMNNKLPFDPGFYFNTVDVHDVVKYMIIASKKAKSGQRYILGSEKSISSTEIFEIAHKLFPEVKIKPKRPKAFLMRVAFIMEVISKLTHKQPLLQRSLVEQFSNPNYDLDISKAKNELGYKPKPTKEVVTSLLFRINDEKHNQ